MLTGILTSVGSLEVWEVRCLGVGGVTLDDNREFFALRIG